jgi:hypothetical protein
MESEGLDFQLFFLEVNRQSLPVKWHMTWLLNHFVEQNPAIGNSNQQLIWEELKLTENPSIQRDLWRMLSFLNIDESHSGEIYDQALALIRSQKFAIAIRVHAMTVAQKIALPYAELRQELIPTISGRKRWIESKSSEHYCLLGKVKHQNQMIKQHHQQPRIHSENLPLQNSSEAPA